MKGERMEIIKVVIADANTLLREGLKRIFSAERDLLVVGEAANDSEVAEAVERTKPDLLLLDLNVPRRGAVPLLLCLREKNLPTKIFILSLISEEASLLDTAKSGACGYALKRNSSATIMQAIRRVHMGEIWVDRQVKCAESFAELARQARNAGGPDNELVRALSKREFEILGLVARGLTNHEISKGLFISLRTVKVHLYHVFNKLQVNNRTQAALLLMHSYPYESPEKLRQTNRNSKDTLGLGFSPKISTRTRARSITVVA